MTASSDNNLVVLPRPGATDVSTDFEPPIAAPLEADFTAAFGALLPAAQYITTPRGRFAYYDLPPSSSSSSSSAPPPPQRVLLIHGISTPALGLHPLATLLRYAFPATHFLAFDLWGHGLSDTPCLPHVPGLFLEQVDALLDHVSWPAAHFVGYSLGSTIAAGYTATRTARVESVVYVAPAGLFSINDFSAPEQVLLRGDASAEAALAKAVVDSEVASRDFILSFLEGGDLVVSGDSEARIARGEVVAEAVRAWELAHHAGHAASVVAIVRSGNIMDREETFRQASGTGRPQLAVLGETDEITSLEKAKSVGIEDVVAVQGAGHDVVRREAGEVAEAMGRFWRNLGGKTAASKSA